MKPKTNLFYVLFFLFFYVIGGWFMFQSVNKEVKEKFESLTFLSDIDSIELEVRHSYMQNGVLIINYVYGVELTRCCQKIGKRRKCLSQFLEPEDLLIKQKKKITLLRDSVQIGIFFCRKLEN